MKVQVLLIGLSALLASSASWAENPNYPDTVAYQGSHSLTRAEVKEELAEARRQGLISQSDGDYPVEMPATGPGKTRAQVLQELKEAREQGLLNVADQDYPVIRHNGPGKTRAQVLNELEHARKQGLLKVMGH